mgnify:CR=1 FL=1
MCAHTPNKSPFFAKERTVKTLMRKIRDSKGQGMTEYILLLMAIVALVVLVGPRIKTMVDGKFNKVESDVNGFNP